MTDIVILLYELEDKSCAATENNPPNALKCLNVVDANVILSLKFDLY